MAMPRRKLEPHPFPDQWLEQIVKNLWENKSKGLKPALTQLIEQILNAVMLKERELFLERHPENRLMAFTIETSTLPSVT